MRKVIDLTGQRFGRLIVIKRVRQDEVDIRFSGSCAYWLCRCDCGTETVVSSSCLLHGTTKSCGCLRKEKAGENNFIDLTGNRYGRLVVIEKVEHPGRYVYWLCQCDCGNKVAVMGKSLKNGNTRSCGCLRKENMREIGRTKKRGK